MYCACIYIACSLMGGERERERERKQCSLKQQCIEVFSHLMWPGSKRCRTTSSLWWASLWRATVIDERFEAGGAVGVFTHDDTVVGYHINVGLHHATVVLQRNYVNIGLVGTHLLQRTEKNIHTVGTMQH